jgi:hypothetical protein
LQHTQRVDFRSAFHDLAICHAKDIDSAHFDPLAGRRDAHKRSLVSSLHDPMIGHQEEFQEHDQRWTKNAQDIPTFLAGANPYWPAQDVADLLNLHLELTKKEAVARLTEKWEEDIFTEIMTVSDTLSEGIIKQFPGKF